VDPSAAFPVSAARDWSPSLLLTPFSRSERVFFARRAPFSPILRVCARVDDQCPAKIDENRDFARGVRIICEPHRSSDSDPPYPSISVDHRGDHSHLIASDGDPAELRLRELHGWQQATRSEGSMVILTFDSGSTWSTVVAGPLHQWHSYPSRSSTRRRSAGQPGAASERMVCWLQRDPRGIRAPHTMHELADIALSPPAISSGCRGRRGRWSARQPVRAPTVLPVTDLRAQRAPS
jgi:hypothetical protein